MWGRTMSRVTALLIALAGLLLALAIGGRADAAPGAQTPSGSVLYAATGSQGVAGTLYTLNPLTVAATPVGSLHVGATSIGLTGLAVHPLTHELYGVTTRFNSRVPVHLVKIDKTTAAATDIGPLRTGTGCLAEIDSVGDIAFRADGVLFGLGPCSQTIANLWTIDLITGGATNVSGLGPYPRGGYGLAFLPATGGAQSLYAIPGTANQNLLTLNPANAAVLRSLPLNTGDNDAFNAMTGDPDGLTLLAAKTDRRATPRTDLLVAINATTAAISLRGPLPANLDALAYDIVPAPSPPPPVAEGSPLLFMAIGLLALAGYSWWRRLGSFRPADYPRPPQDRGRRLSRTSPIARG